MDKNKQSASKNLATYTHKLRLTADALDKQTKTVDGQIAELGIQMFSKDAQKLNETGEFLRMLRCENQDRKNKLKVLQELVITLEKLDAAGVQSK